MGEEGGLLNSIEGSANPLKLGWRDFVRQLRGFCEETGGGSGTWIDNGKCFGLGVERDIEGEREEREAGTGSFRKRVVLRPGFAEGRDGSAGLTKLHALRVRKKERKERSVKYAEFTTQPSGGVAFGRIGWTREQDPVSFVRCTTTWDPSLLPDMLRFFAEHVWGLVRPNLLISIIGSSTDLDIRLDHRVKLAQIMEVAAETGAWVTTGGLDSGVSGLIADARLEVENKVPLIGFVPWGLVEGRQALWEAESDWRVINHCEKLPVDDFGAHEQVFRGVKPPAAHSVRLSRGHSHLILVDDGSVGVGGGELLLRASFEFAACKVDETEQQARILQALQQEGLGWQLLRVRDEHMKAPKKGARPVPSIAICVHGDAASIHATAASVRLGSPLLIARGSGGAAELLADCVQMIRTRRQRLPSCEFSDSADRRSNSADDAWDMLSQASGGSEEHGRHDLGERRPSVLSVQENHVYIDQQRLVLLEKLLAPSSSVLERAGLAVHVERVYGIPRVKGFVEVAESIRFIAESSLCHVFDLEKDEDIGGAMLAAILRKERDNGVEWKDCLELIVSWNKVGIMKRTLDRLRKVTARTRKAVEGAFHTAFLNNKTDIAHCLLEHLECTSAYNVSYGAVGHGGLFSSVLMSLRQQKKESTRAVMLWGHLACTVLKHGYGFDGGLVWERWADLYERAQLDEEARKLLARCKAPVIYSESAASTSLATFHSRARRVSFTSTTRRNSMGSPSVPSSPQHSSMPSPLRRNNSGLTAPKKAVADSAGPTRELEHVYKSLLGHEFWYETSVKGPELDLFLWCLLLRRKKMAKMLWARMDMPVRSMLLASTLYRKWVKAVDLKMHVREALVKDADEFEQMAVEVQQLLMRCDANVALEAMERQSDLWKGLTGVDLAVMGDNQQFIERCCAEAFDCRWTGDIHPYGQRFGLYPTVLLSVCSLGLLAPTLLVFRPPPRAENLRQPAQRRKIPAGYYEKPRVFEERYRDLEAVQEGRSLLLKLQSLNLKTGSTYLDHLETGVHGEGGGGRRDNVQSSWGERYKLFASAPVTIFMIDAIQQVAYNVLFTSMLIGDGAMEHAMCWKELVLCWSVLSTTVYEALQLILDGGTIYFASSWNWFRALSSVLFWLGLATKTAKLFDGHSSELYVSNLCYACSLFFMWLQVLHLLSVHRALGPLVIAFSRMRDDVVTFGTIWAVLLMAFATAMHCARNNAAPRADTGSPELLLPMQHWDLWWLVRTYFQSFGEPFYEELHTDASNVVMMVMFPVMNLMLVNLLVAIMNDTYSEVKEQSKLQWMVQMFYIAKEYRSPSRLNLALLIVDVVYFVRYKENINRRTKKLNSNQPGLRGWFVDERFRFKRFLSRDLPAWERADEEEELTKQIQRLEDKEVGTASHDMGIPGRVWMTRQIEWHADVSALGVHQFIRKEMAIKAGLKGCVAVPVTLDLGNPEDGEGCVCIFFANRRFTAGVADRIVIELHKAVSANESQPQHQLHELRNHHHYHHKTMSLRGGAPKVVAVLERVCSVHDLCYAEASRPTTTEGAAMRCWAHVCESEKEERFFRDSHGSGMPFALGSKAQRGTEPKLRSLRAIQSHGDSPLRSLTRPASISRMSSEASLSTSMASNDEESESASFFARWLSPFSDEKRQAKIAEQRADTKNKLKERLSKLRQKRKQDEEAARSIQKMIAVAKVDYLREKDEGHVLRMPEGFRKMNTNGDI